MGERLGVDLTLRRLLDVVVADRRGRVQRIRDLGLRHGLQEGHSVSVFDGLGGAHPGAGDLRAAKHLFASTAADARAAIALDGAGDERVVHRALGSRRFRIAFRGSGGHSWTAYGVPNAVHAAALAATKLARLVMPAEPRTTLSVGRIGGGIAVNAIPDDAWLEVDLRSTASAMLDRYEREIHAAARVAADEENARRMRGSSALDVTVSPIGNRPGGETAAAHPLVALAAAVTRLVGREPELATASTDANVPISRGIPAIAVGAGGHGGDAHSPTEWFDNRHGHTGLARALAIVVGAAGLQLGGAGIGSFA